MKRHGKTAYAPTTEQIARKRSAVRALEFAILRINHTLKHSRTVMLDYAACHFCPAGDIWPWKLYLKRSIKISLGCNQGADLYSKTRGSMDKWVKAEALRSSGITQFAISNFGSFKFVPESFRVDGWWPTFLAVFRSIISEFVVVLWYWNCEACRKSCNVYIINLRVII